MPDYGQTILVRELNDDAQDTVLDSIKRLLKHGPVRVSFKPGDKRSLGQNDKFWALCSGIAETLTARTDQTITKQDVHDRLLAERYGYRERVIEGKAIAQLPKTHKFSVAQMSDLIEWSLAWAADRDIKVVIRE